jgi:hypothetical protein
MNRPGSQTYVQPMTVTQDGQWRLSPNGALQLLWVPKTYRHEKLANERTCDHAARRS